VGFIYQYSLLPCIQPDGLSHAALHSWFESLLNLICPLSLMPVKSCTSMYKDASNLMPAYDTDSKQLTLANTDI
jgi:hypothetical protein